jgi:hypothetical protein
VRGGKRPRRFHYLCTGPALDANLLTSDYKNPLPDSSGHDGPALLEAVAEVAYGGNPNDHGDGEVDEVAPQQEVLEAL